LRSSRRDFFRAASLLSAAAIAPSFAPTSARANGKSTDTTDDPIFMSAKKLAGLIREKKISATEAVNAISTASLDINDELNAVCNNATSGARPEAKRLDEMAALREWAGPLHGVP